MQAGVKVFREFWTNIRPKHLIPDDYARSIDDIEPSSLKEKGIRGIIWDVDGVLMRYHGDKVSSSVEEAFLNIREALGSNVILSNSDESRFRQLGDIFYDLPVLRMYEKQGELYYRNLERGIDNLMKKEDGRFISVHNKKIAELDISYYRSENGFYKIAKPDPRLIHFAAEFMKIMPEETVMIGDKLPTDISGGNRGNAYTIHITDRIDPKEDRFHHKLSYFFSQFIHDAYRE